MHRDAIGATWIARQDLYPDTMKQAFSAAEALDMTETEHGG